MDVFFKDYQEYKNDIKKRVASEQKRLTFSHHVVSSNSRIISWHVPVKSELQNLVPLLFYLAVNKGQKNE